jgi:hypothetical protein
MALAASLRIAIGRPGATTGWTWPAERGGDIGGDDR